MIRLLLAVSTAAGLATAVLAADTTGISVTQAWSRATIGAGTTGVVYLTVTDTGAPDRLTSASTPIAATAQLHESKTVNGIMEMRPVDALPIAPGAPISLAPGGNHLMLTGLTQKLKAGDHFTLVLTFEHAGSVNTDVSVQAAGASAPDQMDMGGMKMDHQ